MKNRDEGLCRYLKEIDGFGEVCDFERFHNGKSTGVAPCCLNPLAEMWVSEEDCEWRKMRGIYEKDKKETHS